MGRPAKRIKIQECLEVLNEQFASFSDPRSGFSQIELKDFLLSSYAVFALKHPSLLAFEKEMKNEKKAHNLKKLFGITSIPSDTHLRDIMDELDFTQFRRIFKKLFAKVQRTKLFERYEFIRHQGRPHYLLAADGTGYFRSDKIGCNHCLKYKGSQERKAKKFGHNMLAASLVHPDFKEVFPLCPEPIYNRDGKSKNDCEQNAFKRFVKDFRREHPKLDVVMSLDALYATEPPVRLLFEHDCSFIMSVKETNGTVYMQVNEGEEDGLTKHHEYNYEVGDKVKKNVHHKYRYCKNVRLNQKMTSPKVNFVEFWETITWEGKNGPEEQKRYFAWITDLDVNKESIVKIMRGGRTRWKIENETFNTLKNQGYNLEHNYGHGKKNLSINFIMMMFLAFLIDQIQQASCQKFKEVLKKKERLSYVWKTFASQFEQLLFENWEEFYGLIVGDFKLEAKLVNTS